MAEFRIYRSEQGSLSWYLIGDSGRKLAQAGEQFESMDACRESIEAVKYDVPRAELVDRKEAETIEQVQERVTGAVAKR